jgi:hypothetical protein
MPICQPTPNQMHYDLGANVWRAIKKRNLEANDAVIDRDSEELAHVLGDILRRILKPSELCDARQQRHKPSTNKPLQRRSFVGQKCHYL